MAGHLVNITRHPEAKERRQSAVRAAKAILELDLYAAHKRELLSVCIWKITEADGKYLTRFQTKAALMASRKALQHEHVFQRSFLINALLRNPEKADSILKKAVACVVTKKEHRRLTALSRRNPMLQGWERYHELGIRVIDTATGEAVHV